MKRNILIGAAVAIVAVLTVTLIWGRSAERSRTVAEVSAPEKDWLVAGPGRVEPASEAVKLGSEMSGKLKQVYVEEGAAVVEGQLLAELVNDDYRAQAAGAAAEVRQREAELRKVINGARSQEREEALSSVHESEAVMNNAEAEMRRRQKLYAAGVISKEEADRFAKEFEVAQARYQAKVQSHALVDDEAREEDRSVAEANLASARARLSAAEALLAKTYLRSPLDGTVLRKHHRTGEGVSNGSTSPDPVFTLGDKRSLRVRMDVDESDVSKLRVGERAYVTADAYGEKRFPGHIVRIGEELGRKNVRTDEPTERVDTKILETLIQLDPGVELPVGLRVNAFVVSEGK